MRCQQHHAGRQQPAPQTAPETPELIAKIGLGFSDPEGVEPVLVGGDFPTDRKRQHEQRCGVSRFQRRKLGVAGIADCREER